MNTEAQVERDIGIAQVVQNNKDWIARGIKRLQGWRGAEFTGEQVREWLIRQGFEEPTHPNAWGALINTAVRRGILVDTLRTVKMTAKKSHARRTPVWRVAA